MFLVTEDRLRIIREIQDYCADLLETGAGWNEANADSVAALLNEDSDPWALFIFIDEQTGHHDVGYRTRDGREWFPILRQMRNSKDSGLLEALGDYDFGARGRAL